MWKVENINQIFQTIKDGVITQLLKLYNRANTENKWHYWAQMVQTRFSLPWRYKSDFYCCINTQIHAGSKTLSCLDLDQIFLTTTRRSRKQKIRIFLNRISITNNQQTAAEKRKISNISSLKSNFNEDAGNKDNVNTEYLVDTSFKWNSLNSKINVWWSKPKCC